MQEATLDAGLSDARSADVTALARFFGGKFPHKDDAIAYIKAALNNPELVRATLSRCEPNELLALQLLKHFDGAVSAGGLTIAVCTLGASLPRGSTRYSDNLPYLFEAINRHRLFTQNRSSDWLRRTDWQVEWRTYYRASVVYTDARILAQIQPPQFAAFDIAPLENAPSAGIARRPQNTTFHVLGLLNAIQKMNGLRLNKTQGQVIRAADLAKLATLLKWDKNDELDGRPFPYPTEAFIGALVGADLLTRQEGVLVPSDVATQFAALPYAAQAKKLMLGFVNNQAWNECDLHPDNLARSLMRDHLTAGRMGLLAVLMALPQDERGYFALSDIEQAWFQRVGEVFSLAYRPPPPSGYNRTPTQIKNEQQKWLDNIRDLWLKADARWMAQALSTWAYQLGLVELCAAGEDLVTAIRLTDLGREVLHGNSTTASASASGASQPANAEQSAWVIQPTFEIVAYLDHLTPPQLAFLNLHAECVSSLQHTAHYRLTRDSVYRGLESGTAVDDLLATLQAGARNPLPQNIVVELKSWAQLRERIVLHRNAHLVEFASQQGRDAALAGGLPGAALGDRFALLQPDAAAKIHTDKRVDYKQPPIKCVSIRETGKLTLRHASADILIGAQLTRWAKPVSAQQWQLTQASVAAAIKTGAVISDLYALLESRGIAPLPALLKLALRHWAGGKRAAPATIQPVTILRCADSKTFYTILGSEQLKPFLHGCLGEDAVLVDASAVDAVQQIIKWAGL